MGLFIVEGIDGSGKSTQIGLLRERFQQEGKEVVTLKFPVYEELSSGPLRMYLAGELGSNPDDVNAFAASSFFAIDRFASYKKHWEKDYKAGKLIISDRYTVSNIIHQSSKLPVSERIAFSDWLYGFEYGKLGIPVPDRIFYLDVPPEISMKLVEGRYGGDMSKKDIHEKDMGYLQRCYEAGLYACEHLDIRRIECVRDGKMRPAAEINDILYREIKNCLNKEMERNTES